VRTNSFQNKLLRNLDAGTIERLGLRPTTLPLRQELQSPGSPIQNLFFVEEGFASMTITFHDGAQVEVAIYGYESVVGTPALMGMKRSLNRVYMQLGGHGFYCPVKLAKKEFDRHERFHQLVLHDAQAHLTAARQATGCNARHEVEERLASWLLLCADRARSDKFTISHEFLAEMLGSTRPTVSVAAASLRHKGLIEYCRGTMQILDHRRTEERACECYHVLKEHFGSGMELDTVAIREPGVVIRQERGRC
jgi:CRP-like cAMP-binding protein